MRRIHILKDLETPERYLRIDVGCLAVEHPVLEPVLCALGPALEGTALDAAGDCLERCVPLRRYACDTLRSARERFLRARHDTLGAALKERGWCVVSLSCFWLYPLRYCAGKA